jgi:hypothetical protein
MLVLVKDRDKPQKPDHVTGRRPEECEVWQQLNKTYGPKTLSVQTRNGIKKIFTDNRVGPVHGSLPAPIMSTRTHRV